MRLCVRRDGGECQHRYSRYSGGDMEIYDLTADPDELSNLAVRDPGSPLRVQLAEQLLDAMTTVAPMPVLGAL